MTLRGAVATALLATGCGPALRLDAEWGVAPGGAVVGIAVDGEGIGWALTTEDDRGLLVSFDEDGVELPGVELPGAVAGPMAREDGSIVVIGTEWVVALDASGDEVWRAELPGTASLPAAVAPDLTVWVAGRRPEGTGFLVRLASNGIVFRDFTPRRPLDTALAVDADGNAYAGTSGFDSSAGAEISDLRAFDPEGDERWTVRVDAPVLDVAVTGDVVFATLEGGGLVAVDRENGGRTWQVDGVGRWPVVDAAGSVFTASEAGVFATGADGTPGWSTTTGCGPLALADDGVLYAPCAAGTGMLPSAITGDGRIHLPRYKGDAPELPARGIAGPVLHDGALYIGGSDGSLLRLSGAGRGAAGWAGPRGSAAATGAGGP